MKRQQSPRPDEAGSHPVKAKKKPGCLGWLARIIGGFIILFVGAAVLSGLASGGEGTAEPEPTATATPEATTPAPAATTQAPVPPAPVEEPPVEEPPAPAPEAPREAPPAPAVEAPPVPEPVVPPAPAGDAPFANCEAVRDAKAAPITPAHPRWDPGLDADGDGQACGDDQ